MNLWILQRKSNVLVHYDQDRFEVEARILGIALTIVSPDDLDIVVTAKGSCRVLLCGVESALPDCVLPRTGSGTDYLSLAILRQFEQLGVPVANASKAIDLAKDKFFSLQILAASGLSVPTSLLARYPIDLGLIDRQISLPCIVKVLSGSYGEGIYLSHDYESLRDLLELIYSLDQSRNLILQQYIGDRPGEDLRLWVIGGRVVGAMHRCSTDGSFKANITRGGVGKTYPLDPMLERIGSRAAEALGLQIAGVDLLFDGDGYRICEVNSSPGFKGFEDTTGINIARHVLGYCQQLVASDCWVAGVS